MAVSGQMIAQDMHPVHARIEALTRERQPLRVERPARERGSSRGRRPRTARIPCIAPVDLRFVLLTCGISSPMIFRHRITFSTSRQPNRRPSAGESDGAETSPRRTICGNFPGTVGGDPEGQRAQGQGDHHGASRREEARPGRSSTRVCWTAWRRSASGSRPTRSTSPRC